MPAFPTFFIIAITATSLLVGFFVLKYTGYAFVTVPDWPIIIGFILITLGATAYLVFAFLTRDSLASTDTEATGAVFAIPVKSTAYAPQLFRYHPFRLLSRKSVEEATFVPHLSYKSWPGVISVTPNGLSITVIKKRFVAREDIASITLMQKGRLGEMMTIQLENGAYYRAWLRLDDSRFALQELKDNLQQLTYPAHLNVDQAATSIDRTPSDSINKKQARTIAQQYLSSLNTADDLEILDDQIEARAFGWVFYLRSHTVTPSQEIQAQTLDLGALVVDMDGKTHQLPSSSSTVSMVDRMEHALEIAQQRLMVEQHNSDQYYVEKIAPIDQQADVWLIRFDIPQSLDAQVEIEVNTKTKEVIKYRDSWS